jgi:type 1 glutamine amidotransferase
MFECELLAKCLRQTPGIKAEVSLGWPEDPKRLENLSAIVFYSSPAGDVVLNPVRRPTFEKILKSGTGYAAIHWATGANKVEQTADYIALLGGCFNFAFANPPLAFTTEHLIQLDKGHPICRGWSEYDLRDEWYLAMRFDPRARSLLKVVVRADPAAKRPDPTDLAVAWTLDRPDSNGGRSFGTTLAHPHDNFKLEAFRKMLVNAILWTAHVEVPSGGAPVALSDADLVLPPAPPK